MNTREQIAAMALQGLLSNAARVEHSTNRKVAAKHAVEYADALLDALRLPVQPGQIPLGAYTASDFGTSLQGLSEVGQIYQDFEA